jgi:transcriptional regulator with XRE-family HTH domain
MTGAEVEYLRWVSRRIRAARVLAGITQDQLAKRASLSRVTLSGIERGSHSAGLLTYRQLSVCLGVRMSWLLDEETPA